MSTFPCTFTFEQKTEEPGSRRKPAKIKNRQSFPIQRVPFLEKRFRPAILTVKARRNHRKGTEHECEETVCDRQFPHGPDMAVAAARGAFNLAPPLPVGGPDGVKISAPEILPILKRLLRVDRILRSGAVRRNPAAGRGRALGAGRRLGRAVRHHHHLRRNPAPAGRVRQTLFPRKIRPRRAHRL